MSMGGFIFSQQTVEPLVGESIFNWCLRLHKARVISFIDASNKAKAGWTISRIDGEFSIDNVRCVYNYASKKDKSVQHPAFGTFFKHIENGKPTAYFWLGTYSAFTLVCKTTTLGQTYYPEIDLSNFQSLDTSLVGARRLTGSCIHAFSLSDFGSDSPASSEFLSGISTRLTSSTGVFFENQTDNDGLNNIPLLNGIVNNRGEFSYSFGYAVRDDSIEMFYRYNDSTTWNKGEWIITLVGNIIDQIILSDIDTVRVAQIVLNGHKNSLDIELERSKGTIGMVGDESLYLTCFTQEGRSCPSDLYCEKTQNRRNVKLFYENPCVRYGGQTPNKIPYTQAVFLITGDTKGTFAHDGSWAKGFVSSDILRVVDGKFVETVGTTNSGHYFKVGSVNDGKRSVYGFLVGWDASNEDLR